MFDWETTEDVKGVYLLVVTIVAGGITLCLVENTLSLVVESN